jgi:MFS family permease
MIQTRTPWLLIGALYLAGLIAATQFAKTALTLAPLATQYPDAPVAFIVSGVAVMGVIFGVVAGGVTASLGPRRAILIGLAISALTGLGQSALPSFPLLMGLRVLEGAGHLLLVVAVPTLMAALASDRDRSVVMGIWATFFGVGFALASVLIGENAGLSPVLLIHALLAASLCFALWVVLPKGFVPATRRWPSLADHVAIYKTPRRFAPALGHGIYAALFLALVTYLPTALGAPWLSTILPLAGLLGSLVAGILARFVAPSTLVWGGFLGMAVLFAVVPLIGAAGPILAILAMGVSGIVAGGGFAAVPWLNEHSDDRALANGALAQLGNIGTFSGTPILAALGASGSVPMAVVGGIIGAVLTLWAYRAAIGPNVR